MTQSLEQFLYSVVSIVIGGGIAIATQWVLAREKQKSDNREKLRERRLEKYSAVWDWLCNYDKPSADLESIHSKWMLSNRKYWELRSLVMNARPFLSDAMREALQELQSFWRSDLLAWRGSQPIAAIGDRAHTQAEEYDKRVERILSVSQSEINTIFNLEH